MSALKPCPSEVERHADNILRAAGSGLRHYTMPATRQAILEATAEAMRASDELVELLAVFLGEDERFQIAIGGNPNAIEEFMGTARTALAKHRGQG